jgi:hypoxanthine phosphoribosyltransferase
MNSQQGLGDKLARKHAKRFRVVGYEELRDKATAVAGQVLRRHKDRPDSLIVVPIMMGGGLPARMVLDVLMGYGVVHAVVPCRIKRYTGIGEAGEAEIMVELSESQIQGRVVLGVDDLVDGGQTLVAFRQHTLGLGASAVEEAVIFAKPHSVAVPTYCAESGVEEWLVMPGEEHDFMRTIVKADAEVGELPPNELAGYFTGLGLPLATVRDWQQFHDSIGVIEA